MIEGWQGTSVCTGQVCRQSDRLHRPGLPAERLRVREGGEVWMTRAGLHVQPTVAGQTPNQIFRHLHFTRLARRIGGSGVVFNAGSPFSACRFLGLCPSIQTRQDQDDCEPMLSLSRSDGVHVRLRFVRKCRRLLTAFSVRPVCRVPTLVVNGREWLPVHHRPAPLQSPAQKPPRTALVPLSGADRPGSATRSLPGEAGHG